MIRRPPRSTLDRSSAASDVYKRQDYWLRQWATGSGAGAKAWSEEAGQVSIMGKVLHLSSEFERYSEALSLIHISEPTRPY